MQLETSNPCLHWFALHFAIPGVPAGSDGFPDNYQITASLAKCFEAGFTTYRRRRCRDLRNLRSRRFWREATEGFADDAITLTWPYSGAMLMPLVPPICRCICNGKRKTSSTLVLPVQNKIQRIVRIDAAAITRAVCRNLGNGIAIAIAALLLLTKDKHRCTLKHLTGWHCMSRSGASLNTTDGTGCSTRTWCFNDDDFCTGELSCQRIYISFESFSAART